MTQDARDILGEEGLAILGSFVEDSNCLVALDFDGTLAPITQKPDDAAMKDGVFEVLEELTQIQDVLILTGRSVPDATRRLPRGVQHILGNHGLEGSAKVSAELLESAKNFTERWLEQLEASLGSEPDFSLEDKVYSLTIHFRQAPVERVARLKAKEWALALDPQPSLIDGKCVVNVIPPGLPNKKTALTDLLDQGFYSKAIFVGDDVTDNYVFRACDPRILSIKVGKKRELHAAWFLKNQVAIEALLKEIVRRRRQVHEAKV